jgi:methylthioribose-1-phosphate isomerase
LKNEDPYQATIQIIDQRWLPHRFVVEDLTKVEEVATAIKDMHLRGAPLIGAAAAFGLYFAVKEAPDNNDFANHLHSAFSKLLTTRPTAINLAWALNKVNRATTKGNTKREKIELAFTTAKKVLAIETENCRQIGLNGLPIIEKFNESKKGKPINILTHCNAGWLACVDYGTATAPIYLAHDRGIPLHVWVDETRPRNQGARLTAWELQQHGIPHTVITDNAGGHLMQHGLVDMVIVGSDRTTRRGDVGNKIGTYLKALAAYDNQVPFYVALPSSTFDFSIQDGVKEIPVERRSDEEVRYIQGFHEGEIKKVLLAPEQSPAANFAFDVTPARLVTSLITERGMCDANEKSILALFPEHSSGF